MSAKVGRNLIQFNQIIFDSKHSCLCSIGYINFFKDIRNVIFYCSLTDIQRCCNFLIEHSVSNLNKSIGAVPKNKKTIEALGLTKLGKTVELPNNAATQGAVRKVAPYVKVEEV